MCGGRGKRNVIDSDLKQFEEQIGFKICRVFQLLYHLHTNSYFRTLFYHRIGVVWGLLIGWYRPGNKYFQISATTRIGEGMWMAHPYSTIINADSIGKNFRCIHLTTIGAKSEGRPTIGDNVSLGANVTIGAGSVVVEDIPDNCIAVGNPAKVIRTFI